MNEFERSSYLAQLKRLRTLAKMFLKYYAIKVVSLNFIQYGENATFRVVDNKNNKYLLKLHREIYHSKPSLLEEHKWLTSLAHSGQFCVPTPVLNIDKHSLTVLNNNLAPNFTYADIFEWVEGRFVWKSITKRHVKQLGIVMGQLQKQGKKLKMHHRPHWNTEGLLGVSAKLGNIDNLYDIPKVDQHKISAAKKIIFQQLHKFEKANPDKIGLIHADLHFGNFLVQKNGVGVIDFDDCGTGFYGYDLMVPIFALEYLIDTQRNKDIMVFKDALYEGYSENMSLTQQDLDMAPYFLCARKLAMLAWLQSRSSNPKLKVKLCQATKRAIRHIRRDLGTRVI